MRFSTSTETKQCHLTYRISTTGLAVYFWLEYVYKILCLKYVLHIELFTLSLVVYRIIFFKNHIVNHIVNIVTQLFFGEI